MELRGGGDVLREFVPMDGRNAVFELDIAELVIGVNEHLKHRLEGFKATLRLSDYVRFMGLYGALCCFVVFPKTTFQAKRAVGHSGAN
jgi:hypothetical protein